MNYDPYWDTIEEAPPQVQMYDPAKGQKSPVDPFDLEIQKRTQQLETLLDMRDQAKAEAEKAMTYTGRNPIEQAIVGLAPMALGALLGGKQGLGAGGIGTVAGLKAYDSYADEEAKRQQLIAAQFYKDAQANVSASQKALDALRGDQMKLDFQKQADLELADKNIAGRLEVASMRPGNPLDDPASPEVLALAQGVFPEGIPEGVYTNRQLGQMTELAKTKQMRESNELAKEKKDRRDIAETYSQNVDGVRWKVLPGSPAQRKAVEEQVVAFADIDAAYTKLRELFKSVGGQPITKEQGEAARQLTNAILSKIKNVKGYGAAFSEFEIALAKAEGGLSGTDIQSTWNWMAKDLVLGGGAESRARLGQEAFREEAAIKLAPTAPLTIINYNTLSEPAQKALRGLGVSWNENGQLTTRDALEDRVAEIRSMSSNRGQIGGSQAPTKNLKEVIAENYPNIEKGSVAEKANALNALKKLGYPQEQIIPLLGVKDGGK